MVHLWKNGRAVERNASLTLSFISLCMNRFYYLSLVCSSMINARRTKSFGRAWTCSPKMTWKEWKPVEGDGVELHALLRLLLQKLALCILGSTRQPITEARKRWEMNKLPWSSVRLSYHPFLITVLQEKNIKFPNVQFNGYTKIRWL